MVNKIDTAASHPLYSVHPSVAYLQAIIANLPQKTGRSIDEWIRLVHESGPGSEKERRDWLRKEFKLGGTTAAIIAERAEGKADDNSDPQTYLRTAEEYVEAMYAGPKADLRVIHDELIKLGKSLGEEVKICPCKTIVPLYRNHVFAEIKPATRTRIDLGLALNSSPETPPARLLETGGLQKGDRITHRFAISSTDEVDYEVRRWLALAYELDG